MSCACALSKGLSACTWVWGCLSGSNWSGTRAYRGHVPVGHRWRVWGCMCQHMSPANIRWQTYCNLRKGEYTVSFPLSETVQYLQVSKVLIGPNQIGTGVSSSSGQLSCSLLVKTDLPPYLAPLNGFHMLIRCFPSFILPFVVRRMIRCICIGITWQWNLEYP